MEQTRTRVLGFVQSLSVAHRITILTAAAVLVVVLVLFGQWLTSPSYTVLYSGLADDQVAEVVDSLETAGVDYRLESGGSTVMVPRDQLYATRADLAATGISGSVTPEGWEILDGQGLSVSDFRQQVDYQRALEGELAKTLGAMDGVDAATVTLVLPEDELFAEEEKPASASVLLDTRRDLSVEEVETVTFLVSSGVEGLDTDQITVADADGTTLHAPGDASGQTTNRNLRQTREYETALAGDVESLLQAAGGGPASVVVRAQLNFDETNRESETYDPASQVELKGQRSTEEYTGTGTAPGGVVGVDGGPVAAEDGGESEYLREEELSEYGVDKVTETTRSAPGRVEQLSVAIVMDDGSLTGTAVPAVAEVERLVASALGLEPERGDTIAVTPVPFPADEEAEAAAGDGTSLSDLLTLVAALLVFVIVAVALLLMTRRSRRDDAEPGDAEELEWEPVDELPDPGSAPAGTRAREDGPAGAVSGEPPQLTRPLDDDVRALVSEQPEEMAVLLRSWLADRRT